MLLEDKNAVIYGAGGVIDSAMARAFVREGTKVCLAGRTLATIDAVAKEISAAGGVTETAQGHGPSAVCGTHLRGDHRGKRNRGSPCPM
jgi:NAD(P)-dependent dehydrogenase (short-subunit alcohol dehydrogenase family)